MEIHVKLCLFLAKLEAQEIDDVTN